MYEPRLLMFIGFIVIIIGMVMVMLSMRSRGMGSTTGFILLGPIPIMLHGSRISLLLLVPIAALLIFIFVMVMLR
jgi:uncharacterized membrane protein